MATPVIPVEDLIVVLSDGRVVAAQPVYVVPDSDPVQDAAGRWVQPTAIYFSEGAAPSQSLTLSNNTIAENSPADTLIGTFTVGGEVDGWAFVISLNDPTIKLITNELYTTGVPLDYESTPEPEFRVTATQSDPYISITRQFTLNVTDVVEIPNLVPLTFLSSGPYAFETEPGTVLTLLEDYEDAEDMEIVPDDGTVVFNSEKTAILKGLAAWTSGPRSYEVLKYLTGSANSPLSSTWDIDVDAEITIPVFPATQTITFGALTPLGYGGKDVQYIGSNYIGILTEKNAANANTTHFRFDSHGKLVIRNGATTTYGNAPPALSTSYTVTVAEYSDAGLTVPTGNQTVITITIVANEYTVNSIASGTNADTSSSNQLRTALTATSVVPGVTVRMRDGMVFNPNWEDWRIRRPVSAAVVTAMGGSGVGLLTSNYQITSVVADNQWIQIRPETAWGANICRLQLEGNNQKIQGFWFRDVSFDQLEDGVKTHTSILKVGTGSAVSATSHVRITGCRFRSNLATDVALSGTKVSTAIEGALGSQEYLINKNLFDGVYNGAEITGMQAIVGSNNQNSNIWVFDNHFTNVWNDCEKYTNSCPTNSLWNLHTNKRYGTGGLHGDYHQRNFDGVIAGSYPMGVTIGNAWIRALGMLPYVDGQGYFQTAPDATAVSFTGCKVLGNVYVGTMGRGITLDKCIDPVVDGNSLIHDNTAGVTNPTPSQPSGIYIGSGTGGSARYNVTSAAVPVIFEGGHTGGVAEFNLGGIGIAQAATAYMAPAYGSNSDTLDKILAAWSYKPGGVLDKEITGYDDHIGAMGTGKYDFVDQLVNVTPLVDEIGVGPTWTTVANSGFGTVPNPAASITARQTTNSKQQPAVNIMFLRDQVLTDDYIWVGVSIRLNDFTTSGPTYGKPVPCSLKVELEGNELIIPKPTRRDYTDGRGRAKKGRIHWFKIKRPTHLSLAPVPGQAGPQMNMFLTGIPDDLVNFDPKTVGPFAFFPRDLATGVVVKKVHKVTTGANYHNTFLQVYDTAVAEFIATGRAVRGVVVDHNKPWAILRRPTEYNLIPWYTQISLGLDDVTGLQCDGVLGDAANFPSQGYSAPSINKIWYHGFKHDVALTGGIQSRSNGSQEIAVTSHETYYTSAPASATIAGVPYTEYGSGSGAAGLVRGRMASGAMIKGSPGALLPYFTSIDGDLHDLPSFGCINLSVDFNNDIRDVSGSAVENQFGGRYGGRVRRLGGFYSGLTTRAGDTNDGMIVHYAGSAAFYGYMRTGNVGGPGQWSFWHGTSRANAETEGLIKTFTTESFKSVQTLVNEINADPDVAAAGFSVTYAITTGPKLDCTHLWREDLDQSSPIAQVRNISGVDTSFPYQMTGTSQMVSLHTDVHANCIAYSVGDMRHNVSFADVDWGEYTGASAMAIVNTGTVGNGLKFYDLYIENCTFWDDRGFTNRNGDWQEIGNQLGRLTGAFDGVGVSNCVFGNGAGFYTIDANNRPKRQSGVGFSYGQFGDLATGFKGVGLVNTKDYIPAGATNTKALLGAPSSIPHDDTLTFDDPPETYGLLNPSKALLPDGVNYAGVCDPAGNRLSHLAYA